MTSFSKIEKQVRYKFDIFKSYESVELQKVLHLLRMVIDIEYYYLNKSKEDIIVFINKIIPELGLDEEGQIEMERKVFYHLTKHILLKDYEDEYNIEHVYLKEWL